MAWILNNTQYMHWGPRDMFQVLYVQMTFTAPPHPCGGLNIAHAVIKSFDLLGTLNTQKI